jgi:hypothetical protein
LRPNETATSLSHTLTRLNRKAITNAGVMIVIGEIPNALMATISFEPAIRAKTVVLANSSVAGKVYRITSKVT